MAGAGTHRSVSAPPQEVVDLATARAAVAMLQAALARAEAHERALVDELQHRVRNMLAMIRSIARQTWEEGASQKEYAQHLQGRLDAVARYQTRFTGFRPAAFDLEDMIRDELLKTCCLDGPRCTIAGPAIALRGREAELFGLALHELATNAIKFGAFAGNGDVAVSWSTDDGHLAFRWAETGVAIASVAPRPSGFGRRLIETGLPYELGATTSWDLQPGGLVCTVRLTVPDAQPASTDAAEATAPNPSDPLETSR